MFRGPAEVLKIQKEGSSNVVGMICHPVEIGLADLSKSGGRGHCVLNGVLREHFLGIKM